MQLGDRLAELSTFFGNGAHAWAKRTPDLERVRSLLGPVRILRGQSVVDLGTGTGHILPVLESLVGPAGRVCGLDLSEEMLAYAAGVKESRTVLVRAAAEALPLESRAWDAVICMGIFPHFADRSAALREIHSVLVPGGRIAVLHLIGRERLNALHQELGGAIANDLLPGRVEMAADLDSSGFKVQEVAEMADGYRALGVRMG